MLVWFEMQHITQQDAFRSRLKPDLHYELAVGQSFSEFKY